MHHKLSLTDHQIMILKNILEAVKEEATEDCAELINDSMPTLSFDEQFEQWEDLLNQVEKAVAKI